MIRYLLPVVAALVLPSASARADVADIAELFPAGTLAYAEVGNPGDVATVVAGWVKGTPFENGMSLVHDRKDEVRDVRGTAGQLPVGVATLLTSPEFLREIGRFRGAAVGLTGFTEKSEPQVVAVVLFGESTAGGLLARGFLTTSRELRRVDTVDGVPILQHRAFPPPAFGNDGKPLPFENPKPAEGTFEATYAYRPGLLVVGTHKAAVADVIRRFAGKRPGPPLAGQPAFKRFAEERKRPGVFFYAVPPALAKELNAARKVNRDVIDGDALALVNFVANLTALPAIVGNFAVGPDDITLTLRADVSPGHKSPLFSVLAGNGSPRLLAPAPVDAAGAVAFALPPAADRAKAVIGIWDACAKARGELGPLPSERLAEAEKRVGVNVRDGILRRLTAITAVIPERQELPKEVPPLPAIVFHSDSDRDANVLAEAVPRLVQLATSAEVVPQPTTETILGHRIVSIPPMNTVGFPALHYAQSGKLLILGLDRKWVARLAVGGGKGMTDEAAGVPAGGAVLGRLRPGPLVRLAAATQASKQTAPLAGGAAADPSGVGALAELFDALPPTFFHVSLEKDRLSATLSMRGFRTGLPALSKKLIPWLERSGAEAAGGEGDTIPRLHLDR